MRQWTSYKSCDIIIKIAIYGIIFCKKEGYIVKYYVPDMTLGETLKFSKELDNLTQQMK